MFFTMPIGSLSMIAIYAYWGRFFIQVLFISPVIVTALVLSVLYYIVYLSLSFYFFSFYLFIFSSLYLYLSRLDDERYASFIQFQLLK